MIVFFMTVFILFGLIALINSFYIFLNNKSFIYLPQFHKKNRSIYTLKYQTFTQTIYGLIFILYGIAIFHFNITSFISHILFILVSIVLTIVLGYIKIE